MFIFLYANIKAKQACMTKQLELLVEKSNSALVREQIHHTFKKQLVVIHIEKIIRYRHPKC